MSSPPIVEGCKSDRDEWENGNGLVNDIENNTPYNFQWKEKYFNIGSNPNISSTSNSPFIEYKEHWVSYSEKFCFTSSTYI